MSDADLEKQMTEAGYTPEQIDVALEQNEVSQIDGLRAALSILAIIGVIALFFTGSIPKRQPGSGPEPPPGAEAAPAAG